MGIQLESELLDRWRRGDAEAGEELFERYYELVYRFFAREVTSDLTPLVQETFTACLEGSGPMNPRRSLRGHVLAIAYRILKAHLRGAPLDRRAIGSDETTEVDLRPRSAAHADIELWTEKMLESSAAARPAPPSDRRRQEQLAWRRLPFDDRVLLALLRVERLSMLEVAEVLGIRSVEVRLRVNRAGDIAREREPVLGDSRLNEEITEEELDGFFRILKPDTGPAPGLQPAAPDPRFAYPEGVLLPREPAQRVQIQIVLDGDLAQLDGTTRQRILDEAREKSGDPELSIHQIRRGSIIVELEISPEAAATLEKLFANGDLKSLGGLPIRAIRRAAPALPVTASGAVPDGAEAALSEFLVSAFTADELRRFVHGLPGGSSLGVALPGASVSVSHLAFEVVRVLVRHGLVGAVLDNLEAERPHRRDEIHRLRQCFEGVTGAAPDSPSR